MRAIRGRPEYKGLVTPATELPRVQRDETIAAAPPPQSAERAGSGRWSQRDLGHSPAETAPGVGLAVSMETEKQGNNTAEPPGLQSRPRAGREQSCGAA